MGRQNWLNCTVLVATPPYAPSSAGTYECTFYHFNFFQLFCYEPVGSAHCPTYLTRHLVF